MEYFEPLSPENTGNADAFFAAIRSPGKLYTPEASPAATAV